MRADQGTDLLRARWLRMNHTSLSRRDLFRLGAAGVGVTFLSRLTSSRRALAAADAPSAGDVFFVQLSDTHWGYRGPANPEADVTLRRAVDAVNALARKPVFAVFTGDLTHDTDDAAERRARMEQFHDIVGKLAVPEVHFLPGEHDAQKDRGAAFCERFGPMTWTFDKPGGRFIGLDNASDPKGALGTAQLAWLDKTARDTPAHSALVVFAHRPLFELSQPWDWFTADGAQAIAILEKHGGAHVFYGHIHQEHHVVTGRVAHHAARSLIFPLPIVGTQEKRAPLPWDAGARDHGLGFRTTSLDGSKREEHALASSAPSPPTSSPSAATPPSSAGGW
ncbi:MAG TPA: metallophosphoesterase [Myxococcota bacterium]